ncbi:helix-turn-helix domain-containing protein [Serratia marcescens]|uniref:helix-turn-helix domain-containing protein n=1 Tax=Serratia marcescens TaxID=615 RepID=UPI000A18C5C1|nr:helix-turn-helix domain-containing protein [Serratia marcescens]
MKEKISNPVLAFEERMALLMHMKDLKKADLARMAGVSAQAVNGWFNRGEVGKASAKKIAAATGVSVDWILEGGPELHELNAHRAKRLADWFSEPGFPEEEAGFFEDLVNGKAAFTDKTARRIEQDYGLPFNHLDAGNSSVSPTKLNDEDKELLFYFHKLTSKSKQEFLENVKKQADFYDSMFEELKKMRG